MLCLPGNGTGFFVTNQVVNGKVCSHEKLRWDDRQGVWRILKTEADLKYWLHACHFTTTNRWFQNGPMDKAKKWAMMRHPVRVMESMMVLLDMSIDQALHRVLDFYAIISEVPIEGIIYVDKPETWSHIPFPLDQVRNTKHNAHNYGQLMLNEGALREKRVGMEGWDRLWEFMEVYGYG